MEIDLRRLRSLKIMRWSIQPNQNDCMKKERDRERLHSKWMRKGEFKCGMVVSAAKKLRKIVLEV